MVMKRLKSFFGIRIDMFATQKDVAYINEKIKERDKL